MSPALRLFGLPHGVRRVSRSDVTSERIEAGDDGHGL